MALGHANSLVSGCLTVSSNGADLLDRRRIIALLYLGSAGAVLLVVRHGCGVPSMVRECKTRHKGNMVLGLVPCSGRDGGAEGIPMSLIKHCGKGSSAQGATFNRIVA
jgi:hypothetical protein